MYLMLNMMMMISFLFMWINHPLVMAIVIIMQTILASMIIGMMLGSFWFSYIILIIMLSGMLVLFIYMASIASNEKFKFSMKLIIMFLIILTLIMFIGFYSEEEINFILPNNYLHMNLNWLFNSKTMFITMLMVTYLFFTMIVVSKNVNINEGPLRTKK